MTKVKIRRKNLEVVHVDSQFRCTKCGRIGNVGRCCGRDTREELIPSHYKAKLWAKWGNEAR